MLKEKLPESLANVLHSYEKLLLTAKDAGNTANRQKTVVRNAVKSYWEAEQVPIGSYICEGGVRYEYSTSTSRVIDAADVFAIYEAGEITREQLLRIMKVDRKQAENILGGDIVSDLEVVTTGAVMDIRRSALPIEQVEDSYIALQRTAKLRKKRRRFGRGPTQLLAGNGAAAGKSTKIRRRVKKKGGLNG